MTPTNRCLDGETLAAWVDGGLSRNDAAMAEAHVSSCPRCQEIAGLIVKTTPVTIVDAPWWRRRAAWLVPVSVGVAAVGLLMIAPTNPAPRPEPPPATATTARNDSARPAATPAGPPVAPPAETKAAARQRQKDNATSARRPRAASPGLAASPGAPAAPSAATPSAAAAPPAAATERLAAERAHGGSSPRPAPRKPSHQTARSSWRITDRGALERSTDGGTTWQAVNVGITATFTTVQAPEPRVALVTTTDGRIFRTSDGGTTWRLQEF